MFWLSLSLPCFENENARGGLVSHLIQRSPLCVKLHWPITKAGFVEQIASLIVSAVSFEQKTKCE